MCLLQVVLPACCFQGDEALNQIRGRRIRNKKLSEPKLFTAPLREG
jgi:hypothetical protein